VGNDPGKVGILSERRECSREIAIYAPLTRVKEEFGVLSAYQKQECVV
jgi:hypothetical protein